MRQLLYEERPMNATAVICAQSTVGRRDGRDSRLNGAPATPDHTISVTAPMISLGRLGSQHSKVPFRWRNGNAVGVGVLFCLQHSKLQHNHMLFPFCWLCRSGTAISPTFE